MADYNPLDYVKQPGRNVRQFGQLLGAGVAAIPGEIRAEEEFRKQNKLREQAVKEAKEDWSTIENNWKTMRTTYIKKARPLVQQGIMTEEEYNSNLKRIKMPINADKKDPGRYLDDLAKSSKELFDGLKGRQRSAQVSQIGQQAQQPTPTQFTEEFGRALETPPSQFQPSATPQAIQTPSQPAPADTEGVLQKAGQIAHEQGIGPLTKEEQGMIAGTAGTQTAQQVATKQHQAEQDKAKAEQQKITNKRLQDAEARRKKTAQATAAAQKVRQKQQIKKSEIDSAIKVFNIDRDDINDQIAKKQTLLDVENGRKGPEKNQKTIDGLDNEITELEERRKVLSKDIKDLIKAGVNAPEEQSQQVTVEDIHAKFGPLEPGSELEAKIQESLKAGNPETGTFWTLDEIYNYIKTNQPQLLPQQTSSGYAPPTFGQG